MPSAQSRHPLRLSLRHAQGRSWNRGALGVAVWFGATLAAILTSCVSDPITHPHETTEVTPWKTPQRAPSLPSDPPASVPTPTPKPFVLHTAPAPAPAKRPGAAAPPRGAKPVAKAKAKPAAKVKTKPVRVTRSDCVKAACPLTFTFSQAMVKPRATRRHLSVRALASERYRAEPRHKDRRPVVLDFVPRQRGYFVWTTPKTLFIL